MPPALVRRLSVLGARTVADYAGYAAAPGAPGRSVHPWTAAALHPYAWVSGGPPRQPGQLVVSAPTRLTTGDRVVVATSLGPRAFTVSGVLRTPAVPAFYATGAVARRLAGGRVTATRGLVAAADAQASRANTRALIVVPGLALVYTVIAIANTLVIATASRRAELAALRLAGATRAQVLRLAGTEAALVAALGTGLAAVVTAVTVAAVRRGLAGVAPPLGAAVPWMPLAAIGLVCLVVAVLGSVLTAAAALRDPGQTLAAAAGV